jgi:hypothetical protein
MSDGAALSIGSYDPDFSQIVKPGSQHRQSIGAHAIIVGQQNL